MHEGGYSVEDGDGDGIRFRNRHGVLHPTIPRPPPAADPGQLIEANEEAGLRIDGQTNRNGCGDRFDLAGAADAVLSVCA